ncbi:hypothetical protein P8631_19185, partial [Guyparkeria sp. 1SP6A2]|nr:hypothetical protein [Guyparkeria sp. 1SP6A2]
VINAHLPQTSGAELCVMLKQQSPRAVICLVADEYTPETERSACESRASMFLCKGAHSAWLAEWLQSRSHRTVPARSIDRPNCLAPPL